MVSLRLISNDDGNNSLPLSSISTIDNFSLESILIRLSIRDLVNMSSVCKDMLSVISNPYFVRYYCHQHGNFPILGLLWNKDDFFRSNIVYNYLPLYWRISSFTPLERVNFEQEPSGIMILSSCNGLLLCRSCDSRYFLPAYYIYNPFTAQYRILPSSPLSGRRSNTICSVSLAFDPLKSPHYKVVNVWNNKICGPKYRVEIFSSENSSWVFCGDGFSFPSMYKKSGVFWKGILNWIDDGGSLLCFDMEKRVTREIKRNQVNLTQWVREKKVNCFGVFGGILRYIEVYKNQNAFDVYDMENDYSGFKLKCNVELDMETFYPMMPNGRLSVLYADDSVGVILLEGKIIIVDFKEQRCEQLCATHQENNRNSDSFSVFQFIESLAGV